MSKKPVQTTLYSLSAKPPTQPDRRSDERFLSLLRVGALIVGGRRELCLIRNISAGGMMIRPYSPIAVGTPLAVELKHGDEIAGVAQWVQDELVGISFDDPIDVVQLLTGSSDAPQPRMPRIELNCGVTVRENSDVHRGRAVNISQGGICLHSYEDIGIGAHVVVSLAGLPAAAGVVKWRDKDSYGIGFNRVFPVSELMNFVQELPIEPPRRKVG